MHILANTYQTLRDMFDPATEGNPSGKKLQTRTRKSASKTRFSLKVNRSFLRV